MRRARRFRAGSARNSTWLTRVAPLAVVGALAVSPGVARAETPAASTVHLLCTAQVSMCSGTVKHQLAGPVAVTVDKPGSSTVAYSWTLATAAGVVCRGTYRPADPPRSWTCPAVPAGAVTFTTPGADGPTSVGLTF